MKTCEISQMEGEMRTEEEKEEEEEDSCRTSLMDGNYIHQEANNG